MSKPLTKSEKFQFSYCLSQAKTPAAQRAAILREGLQGATLGSIRKGTDIPVALFPEFHAESSLGS